MTHLQTSNNYPDMAGLATIQQFSVLNRVTTTYHSLPVTAYSYPINASHEQTVPSGAAPQGLDFADENGANETLVEGILNANVPGFYVFSAPWEVIHSLMSNINSRKSYGLTIPDGIRGPDYVYAISVTPSGTVGLSTYNGELDPGSDYPVLPAPVPTVACDTGLADSQSLFHITVTNGVNGAQAPSDINTNETIYWVRHAEAHPGAFEDGNYVGQENGGPWTFPTPCREKSARRKCIPSIPVRLSKVR